MPHDREVAKIEPNAPLSHIDERSLRRMTIAQAKTLIRRLMGSYPSLSPHDPEMYIANLVALMTGYSMAAGERAVDRVRRESKFMPTEAELYDALEHEKKPSSTNEWHWQAAGLIAERIAYDAAAPSAEDKARVAAAHAEYSRRPIGPDPLDRRRRDDF